MKKLFGCLFLSVLLSPCNTFAHHGGISLAFGPGSPIETNSPLTLPQGAFVVSSRVEQVEWRRYRFADPENKTSFTFANIGLSYGITPYLTGSIFFPYNVKRQESLGTNDGFGDIRMQANLGFNYTPGTGFGLNGPEDTAVSLEESSKTYMGVYAGVTAPTGKSHMRLGGEIDRGMQPGFGSPSFTVGGSIARRIIGAFSLVGELSTDIFTESEDFKFGNEYRANVAGVYEIWGKPESFLSKMDGILEFNLLNIKRDKEFGIGQEATGGTILYITPGMRFSFPRLWNANLGLAVKLPIWSDLNERSAQQGAEGLEQYRLITTLSFFF